MYDFSDLSGKVLIASPYAMKDNIFYESIIYIVRHNKEGAIGLIINHPINQLPTNKLFQKMSESLNLSDIDFDIHLGGSAELERGFFLHTNEYNKNVLFEAINNGLSVSSNFQIIEDISKDIGPQKAIFAVGYTGWSKGQLELELEGNLWIPSELDINIIFDENHKNKWQKSLEKVGITMEQGFTPNIAEC